MIPNRQPNKANLTLAQRSNLIPLTALVYDLWRKRSLSWLTKEAFGLEREFALMLDWLKTAATHRQANERQPCALDVGTSTGNYAIALAQAGFSVTAIDISLPMLEQAQKRIHQAKLGSKILLEQANAEALPYPDQRFELVTLGATLNEFASTEQGLRECSRVLQPNGQLFMMYLCQSTTPTGRVLQRLFELSQIRFPKRENVRRVLEQNGMVLVRSQIHRAVAFELFSKSGSSNPSTDGKPR